MKDEKALSNWLMAAAALMLLAAELLASQPPMGPAEEKRVKQILQCMREQQFAPVAVCMERPSPQR